MPKIELLNCPFCGGKAERVLCQDRNEYGSLIGFPFWAVKCKSCGAEIWNSEEQDGLEPDEMIEVAAKAWNTRASGWIPVWVSCEEALPERDGYYLAYYTFANGRHIYDIAYYNVGSLISDCITHWMPLPDPPKGDAG